MIYEYLKYFALCPHNKKEYHKHMEETYGRDILAYLIKITPIFAITHTLEL